MLNIQGLGDILTINNIRIDDISPSEYEKIEIDKGKKNYKHYK